jgi:hypothetical protein
MNVSILFGRGTSILTILLLFGAAGCGRKPAVHGTVKYAGEIVSYGHIVFIPGDDPTNEAAQTQKAGNIIKDGKYSITLPPGKYRVEITWERKTKLPGRGIDNVKEEIEQLIPAKYNAESTLSREITGSDTLDFDLAE